MLPRKIIYTHVPDPRFSCTVLFLRAQQGNMERAAKMHSRIHIPLNNLAPSHQYGSWISMGTVGWN